MGVHFSILYFFFETKDLPAGINANATTEPEAGNKAALVPLNADVSMVPIKAIGVRTDPKIIKPVPTALLEILFKDSILLKDSNGIIVVSMVNQFVWSNTNELSFTDNKFPVNFSLFTVSIFNNLPNAMVSVFILDELFNIKPIESFDFEFSEELSAKTPDCLPVLLSLLVFILENP